MIKIPDGLCISLYMLGKVGKPNNIIIWKEIAEWDIKEKHITYLVLRWMPDKIEGYGSNFGFSILDVIWINFAYVYIWLDLYVRRLIDAIMYQGHQ